MLERRLVLLDVLQDHCPPATMRAFVHGTGLSTLERWLTDAMEASRLQLADKVLQVRSPMLLGWLPRPVQHALVGALGALNALASLRCSLLTLMQSAAWSQKPCVPDAQTIAAETGQAGFGRAVQLILE